MVEDEFWELVAASRRESGNDTELTSRVLFRRLRTLATGEVVTFVQIWERIRTRLYSWPVADAACLLLGTVEEEDLRPIRDWIISYGRAAAARTAADPDSLVELAADARNARARWFEEFTTEAHIVVSTPNSASLDFADRESEPVSARCWCESCGGADLPSSLSPHPAHRYQVWAASAPGSPLLVW